LIGARRLWGVIVVASRHDRPNNGDQHQGKRVGDADGNEPPTWREVIRTPSSFAWRRSWARSPGRRGFV
jgi:hypothetical protein